MPTKGNRFAVQLSRAALQRNELGAAQVHVHGADDLYLLVTDVLLPSRLLNKKFQANASFTDH